MLLKGQIPKFGCRCLFGIGGGKQRSCLAGWEQLSAEAAPVPPRVSPPPPCAHSGIRSGRREHR